jgi:hypothetical protein
MTRFGSLWDAAFDHAVKTAAYMVAKVYAPLAGANVDTNVTKVADDGVFLAMSTAEQAQNATIKILNYCPAKVNPKPPVAMVSQQADAHVRTRLGLLACMVLIYHRCDGINWIGQFAHCILLSYKTSPALVIERGFLFTSPKVALRRQVEQ